tara:strand:+ start:1269 stop:1823 length:555 start_codon:yes stop_codon:yes gene_type:complete
MGDIKKDRYKLVKNFLTKEELEIGLHYLHLCHERNENNFDTDQNNNGDSMFYGDAFTDTMLIRKLPKMEKETGLSLFPTYSFSRVYTYNAELKKHKDRPSCEISVSIMWGSCGTVWPFKVENSSFELNEGDAIIYLGCDVEHWREPFLGDYHIQSFLHYVDKNGPNKEWKYDRRNKKTDPIMRK